MFVTGMKTVLDNDDVMYHQRPEPIGETEQGKFNDGYHYL